MNVLRLCLYLLFILGAKTAAYGNSKNASIYQISVHLETHEGTQRDLSIYRGHPVIVSMFYTSCEYACPMIISSIKSLIRKFPETDRKDLRVLMISFDPKRDTPKVLKEAMKKYKIDSSKWTFARASSKDTRLIATVLKQKYKQLDNGDFNHNPVISLMDRSGIILGQRDEFKTYSNLVKLYLNNQK